MTIITVQEKEVLLWHATLTRIPHINMKERDTALDILIDYEKNESYLNITFLQKTSHHQKEDLLQHWSMELFRIVCI